LLVEQKEKKKSKNDDDTDELESEPETKFKSTSKTSNALKDEASKQAKKPQNSAELSAEAAAQQMRKRRLVKALSNRLLQENSKVAVVAKDPFFEEKPLASFPFISPYVQSKLAITALNLRDTNMLRSLINNVQHIASMHIGRSANNPLIPAQYAIKYEMRDALELLIDDYFAPRPNRIQIAESMFEKFSTGVYNQRSLGISHIRKLTESRGAKEGNAALGKDQNTMNFSARAGVNKHGFFKCLFEFAFEHGVSTNMYDFLIQKYNSMNETKQQSHFNQYTHQHYYSYDTRFIYENIYRAVIHGHRHLAAHAIQNAPPGHGFNAVHIEVLKADNDAELVCQLRANMCTKKPFSNDLITPIHCASINPNVKYLKTLLSITQDFNIGMT
jgi:hypothetical protein